MKKWIVCLSCVALCVVSLSAQVRFGLGGGYALATDSNYKGGIFFSGQVGFLIGRNFAIELSGSYVMKGDVTGTAAGLSQGSMTRIPLELSFQGRFPIGKIVPYLMAGVGYVLHTFDLDAAVVSDWSAVGFTIDEKVDNAFSAHFGTGVDFYITPMLAINLNAKYLLPFGAKGSWSLTDMGGTAASGTLDGLKLGLIMIGTGVKFQF